MTLDPKRHSSIITNGRDRAGARAMLKGIGFTDDDLARPIIGVANTWIETMPCNFHLRTLAARKRAYEPLAERRWSSILSLSVMA